MLDILFDPENNNASFAQDIFLKFFFATTSNVYDQEAQKIVAQFVRLFESDAEISTLASDARLSVYVVDTWGRNVANRTRFASTRDALSSVRWYAFRSPVPARVNDRTRTMKNQSRVRLSLTTCPYAGTGHSTS